MYIAPALSPSYSIFLPLIFSFSYLRCLTASSYPRYVYASLGSLFFFFFFFFFFFLFFLIICPTRRPTFSFARLSVFRGDFGVPLASSFRIVVLETFLDQESFPPSPALPLFLSVC